MNEDDLTGRSAKAKQDFIQTFIKTASDFQNTPWRREHEDELAIRGGKYNRRTSANHASPRRGGGGVWRRRRRRSHKWRRHRRHPRLLGRDHFAPQLRRRGADRRRCRCLLPVLPLPPRHQRQRQRQRPRQHPRQRPRQQRQKTLERPQPRIQLHQSQKEPELHAPPTETAATLMMT